MTEEDNFLKQLEEFEKPKRADDEGGIALSVKEDMRDAGTQRSLSAVEHDFSGPEWLQQYGESNKTYYYFKIYLSLRYLPVPKSRTVRNVIIEGQLTTKPQAVANNLKKHKWVERARAYDKFQLSQRSGEVRDRSPLQAAKLNMLSDQLSEIIGLVLEEKLQKAIEDPASFSISDLSKLARLQIDAVKTAVDVATVAFDSVAENQEGNKSQWIKLVAENKEKIKDPRKVKWAQEQNKKRRITVDNKE